MTSWYTSHGMMTTDKPLRERPADDHYPTPDQLCKIVVQKVLPGFRARILDPGCGTGPWGRAAREQWNGAEIVGVELTGNRITESRKAGLLDAYNQIIYGDFLEQVFPDGFDAVIGNPPYNLAEEFVLRSLELLRPGGVVAFLLRTAFMESQGRYDRMFSGAARPGAVYSLVERPSFTGDGRTDATAYSVFVWYHEYLMRGGRGCPTHLYWLPWRDVDKPQQMELL